MVMDNLSALIVGYFSSHSQQQIIAQISQAIHPFFRNMSKICELPTGSPVDFFRPYIGEM